MALDDKTNDWWELIYPSLREESVSCQRSEIIIRRK
jgi:hypothetical protein